MPPVDFTQYNSVFTEGGISVSWAPQDGSGAQTIQAVPLPPAIPDEIMAGPTRLWVDFESLSPAPTAGDVITISAVSYVIARVETETELTGGAVLKLRKQ
jgi:hypothetical protein